MDELLTSVGSVPQRGSVGSALQGEMMRFGTVARRYRVTVLTRSKNEDVEQSSKP